MKLMGLPSWMHWVSWFLNALLTSCLTIAIIVVLMCVEWKADTGHVLDFSDPFLLYVFFLLYAMALILFLFAISTFFNSPNLALATGLIVHTLTYNLPSSFITDEYYTKMSFASKAALAIFPNVGLWWGIKVISIEEGKGSGIQWDTLTDRAEPDDPMNMLAVFGFLVFDIFFYALITWYVDAVKPGKFGVAQKWSFPFTVRKMLKNALKGNR